MQSNLKKEWFASANAGDVEKVRKLIQDGVDVNTRTALHYAALRGHLTVCTLLVENGADVNAKTVLHNAARNGHLEVCKLLVENGADVNAKTALHDAAGNGHLETCKLLISHGVDVNAKTALYIARSCRKTQIVAVLSDPAAIRRLQTAKSPISSVKSTPSQSPSFGTLSYISMDQYFQDSPPSYSSGPPSYSSGGVPSSQKSMMQQLPSSTKQTIEAGCIFPDGIIIAYENAVPQINISDVQMLGLLGRGGLGKVWHGKYKGIDVAVKILRDYDNVIVSSMKKHLKHPLDSMYLVNILGYFDDQQGQQCGIVMEKMHGSLRQFLVEKKKISIQQALEIGLQICGGIQHLHFHGITHGDLKPGNILLKKNKNGSFMAKLCDFDGIRIRDSVTKVSEVGPHSTAAYSPPEYFTRKGYSNKCDIYSFGIILNELISGKIPFSGHDSIQTAFAIVQGTRPEIPNDLPDELKALIQRCWDTSTKNRPNYYELTKELQRILEHLRQ